jgi:molybdopterin molybdotransferase
MSRGVDEGDGLLTVMEALARVLDATPVLPPEQVALAQSAGRVLAADVLSDVDVPPFDRVSMDGFALRSSDAQGGEARLRIVGTAAAGHVFPHEAPEGTAVRVMTGAPLPRGCDAVEPIERVTDEGTHVVVRGAIASGQHVAPHGEDMRAGDVALQAGTLVGSAQVGLLATVGRAEVTVHARPLAAVVSTGDELVEVGERPAPGHIRNSNGPMLAVLCRMLGCDPVQLLPVVRDEAESLERVLARALTADLLLISGGVSRGERDFVQDVLPELGVERIFHGVSVQPGKPLWFGRAERCLVFALPGNPVSALTTARIFAGPAVRKMRGLRDPGPRLVSAVLTDGFRRKSGREGWLPAWLQWEGGRYTCRPIRATGSADLNASAEANATWVAPRGQDAFAPGDVVQVLPNLDFAER